MESKFVFLTRFLIGILIYGGVRVFFAFIDGKVNEISWGALTLETIICATLYTLILGFWDNSSNKKNDR